MKNNQRISNGFNKLAPFYGFFSAVISLNKIHKSQLWFLTKKDKYKNAIIIGGGDGKFLAEAVKKGLAEHYFYIDFSSNMLQMAKTRIEKENPDYLRSITFVCGLFNEVPLRQKFDLVVTSYFLDCLSQNEFLIAMHKINAHLSENGTWFFSDFNIPRDNFRKILAKLTIRFIYLIFNFICHWNLKQLPDFTNEFNKYPLTVIAEKYFLGGLLVSRIYKKNN